MHLLACRRLTVRLVRATDCGIAGMPITPLDVDAVRRTDVLLPSDPPVCVIVR